MTITVRPASEADASAACEVLRRSIRELCSADHDNDEQILAAWLKNKTAENVGAWVCSESNFSVVAVEGTKVRGFALLHRQGEILFCYVVPEVIRRGGGKLMLRALEQQAVRWGLNNLFLTSTLTAKPFYEHHGYVWSGTSVSIFGLHRAFPMSKPMSSRGDR